MLHKALPNRKTIYKSLNNIYEMKEAANFLYIDFQKMFDTLSHKRLLNQSKPHGMTGKIYKWLED